MALETAKLASTTFATSPDDKLGVTDIYRVSKSDTINSFQDTKKPTGIDVGGIGKNVGAYGIDQLGKIATKAGLKLEPAVVLGKIISSNPSIRSAINVLQKSTGINFQVPNVLANTIKVVVNGATTVIKNGNFDSVKSLGSVIGTITDGKYNPTVTDKGSTAALVSDLSCKASDYGMPSPFGALTKSVPDKSIIDGAMTTMIPKAVGAVSIPLLFDAAVSEYGKNLSRKYPGIIGAVSKGLKEPTKLPQFGYPAEYDKVKTIFTSADANYSLSTRPSNSGPGLDASYIKESGSYFKDLVKAKTYSKAPSNLYNQEGELISPEGDAAANMTDEQLLHLTSQTPFKDSKTSLQEQYPGIDTSNQVNDSRTTYTDPSTFSFT